jgi:hypothetical protein
MSPTGLSGESARPAQGYAMRLPKFSRRQLAIAAITVAPFAVMASFVLAIRIDWKVGTRRLDGIELLALYLGFFASVSFGQYFRYPLIDPSARWGIFGPRRLHRPKLRGLLLYIALISPIFAFYAQQMREHRLQSEARNAQNRAWHTEQEQLNLSRAQDNARTALEYRQKEARGDKQQGQKSWGERAKQFEDFATFWRGQAAANAAQRKTYEQR